MSVRITEETITTEGFTVTNEHTAHALHHFTDTLKNDPSLALAEDEGDLFALARGMALCLGHAVDDDEGTRWADTHFTADDFEAHFVVIGLVATALTTLELPLPLVLEQVGGALSRYVEVIDETDDDDDDTDEEGDDEPTT